MAKVKVKYLGLMKATTRVGSEEIDAESVGELMDEIIKRHEAIQQHLYERESTDPSLVVTYNGLSIKNIKDYDLKLKDGDEVMLATIISGG